MMRSEPGLDIPILQSKFVVRRGRIGMTRSTPGPRDILNQDNPELCERIAGSIWTQQTGAHRPPKGRATAHEPGHWRRLIEARPSYRLHPNAIKALARCGQGYLLSDAAFYGMLPPLTADYPFARKDQRGARGLRLHETFVGVSRSQAANQRSRWIAPRAGRRVARSGSISVEELDEISELRRLALSFSELE